MQRRHNKLTGREVGATSPECGYPSEQHLNDRPTGREKSNENNNHRVTDASPVNLNNPITTSGAQSSTEQAS